LPVFEGKKITQDYLQKKSNEISYTLINNGLFLDWGIQVGLLLNSKGEPTRVFDGGSDKHSFTLLSDVAQAVVGVLKHPKETHNRAVYVQSAALSQNEAIEISQQAKPDVTIERQNASVQELLETSHKQLSQGGEQIGAAMLGFIITSIFGDSKEYGNLWDEKNDNELLGIKEKSTAELKSLIAEL
jgi:nucleoside-diphosphate-sugar epimerase